MSEDNKELISLSDLPDELNPFKDFRPVAEQKFDELLIQITTDGLDIPKEQADRLIQNAHRAFIIANKINNGPIRGYENSLTLRFPKEGMPALMMDSNANKELLNEDDSSQTAAIIHEMIHAFEEDIPQYYEVVPIETVTLATEFMFAGNSRRPFFLNLTEKIIGNIKDKKRVDSHAIGWRKSLQMLSEAMNVEIDLINESAESIVSKLEKVKNIKESEKITLVQNFINQGIKSSSSQSSPAAP